MTARSWTMILGGLGIWAAHFFFAYVVASIFPGDRLARYLLIAATLVVLAGNAALSLLIMKWSGQAELPGEWTAKLGVYGVFLSTVAVAWQALPALLA